MLMHFKARLDKFKVAPSS